MSRPALPPRLNGFSLVELSIVLVILGLLVGGVLGGQNLIRAAQLRKITEDVENYKTIMLVFREKYRHLPGDMPNATRFWGVHSTLCNSEPGTPNPDGTCNGNGDGRIVPTGDFGERSFFWNHLGHAGLLPTIYEMDWSAGVEIGRHAPGSAFSGAGFEAYYTGPHTATSNWFFEGLKGHILRHGVPNNGVCNSCFNAIRGFLPEEAWSIDQKVDDGKPGLGRVQVAHGEYGTVPLACANTNDSALAATAEYNFESTSCLQVYVID